MEFGLIGEHLSHSFSKQIHEKIGGYNYELKELTREELPSFLFKREFKAINVTIPYKEAVIPYLDEIDKSASLIGAVNCIINKEGKLIGYNTDVFGFMELAILMNASFENKNVLILGNGGASKAIKFFASFSRAKNIFIASRHDEKGTIRYEDIKNHPEIEILVNATPNGMYPHNEDKLLFDFDDLPNLEAVIDLIYNPLKTKLVIEAESRRINAAGGLFMLVVQAFYAIELFTGQDVDLEIAKRTYQELASQSSNIVLIGMPGSGKSTIGNLLRSRLNRKYYDTDELIKEKIGMEIKDYISLKGEESFRDIETEVIKEIYKNTGCIISTGGGVVKRKENMHLLMQNGNIFYIDRDINKLTISDSRPLSKDRESLEKMYKERFPLYELYSYHTINNNDDINKAIEEIIRWVERNDEDFGFERA